MLAQRLSSRTLVLPPHARLREELLNLVYEVGPSGVKVVDKGKIHQDHAVVVRGVVAMLGQDVHLTAEMFAAAGTRATGGAAWDQRAEAQASGGSMGMLPQIHGRAWNW